MTNSNVLAQVSGLDSGVTQVSAGLTNSCAVVNGGAWCWRNNSVGNFGNGTTTSSNVPVRVLSSRIGFPPISVVPQIAAEASHACPVVNGAPCC